MSYGPLAQSYWFRAGTEGGRIVMNNHIILLVTLGTRAHPLSARRGEKPREIELSLALLVEEREPVVHQPVK